MADNASPNTAPTNQTPTVDRAAQIAAAIAEMPDGDEAPAETPSEQPAAPAPKAKAEAKPEEAAEPDPGDDGDPDDEEEAAPKDPELAKRFAAIQKQEKKARDRIAKERAELASLIEQSKAAAQQAQEFAKLAKRAKADPAAVLTALGLTDDDFDAAARQVYLASSKAKNDPKSQAHAAQLRRERENESALEAVARELQEVKAQLKQRDEAAATQAAAERYLDSIAKAVTDEAPLVSALLAKNPAKAKAKLATIAMELIERDGEQPDPEDVIAAYEAHRREELEELGIDPASIGKKAPANSNEAAASTVKAAKGKTLGAASTGTAPAGKPLTRDERIKAAVRDLETGAWEKG